MLRNPTRTKSDPRGPHGLSAWLPEPSDAPFFGLARDVVPERFKPRKLSWLERMWLHVRLWWS